MKISDYQWASVGNYVAHLEQILVLTEVSGEAVYSFRIDSGGFNKLRRRKEKIVRVLEKNNAKLCVYVEQNKAKLGGAEMVVIRGMYKSNLEAIGIAREHAARLKRTSKNIVSMFPGLEEDYDDLPF